MQKPNNYLEVKNFIIILILLLFTMSAFYYFGAPIETESGQRISSSFSGEAYDEGIYVLDSEYTNSNKSLEILDDHQGLRGKSIRLDIQDWVEWEIEVPDGGEYAVQLTYRQEENSLSSIEVGLYVNDELPFEDANSIILRKVWINSMEDFLRDSNNNEIIPSQVTKSAWINATLRDDIGYTSSAYVFILSKGKNNIRLQNIREKFILYELRFIGLPEFKSYEAVSEIYKESEFKAATGEYIEIQAEHALYKSDSELHPTTDNSSPFTIPAHQSEIRINTIGGVKWANPGQWIEWHFKVDTPGLYKINMRVRQNHVRGMFTSRRLFINGEVPFAEANSIPFFFDERWQMVSLGGIDDPFLFYFDEGTHSIRLEVVYGVAGEWIETAQESLKVLNSIYRQINTVTGGTVDVYRDYLFDRRIPEAIEEMNNQSKILLDLYLKINEESGQKSSEAYILFNFSRQLENFYKRPEMIAERLVDFYANIGALGTWITTVNTQPLEVDYFTVTDPGKELPSSNPGLIKGVGYELRRFVESFFTDYNEIGDIVLEGDTPSGEERKSITVWMTSGRDQAQSLKRMIDNSFTPEYGVRVKLNLVQPGVLLPSIVAGTAPDVLIEAGRSEPVNFALRNAVEELNGFADFEKVVERFEPSALVPFELNGKIYGLPETQTFPMLFYRKDILEDLGIDPPQTWQDVNIMIPELQKNYMEFGIPFTATAVPGAAAADPISFYMFLFQRGGKLYDDSRMSILLDYSVAYESFRQWTDIHSNYMLPLDYNLLTRFRTGEMPIAIADYTTANIFVVSAPELRGLYGMIPVPGHVSEDGTINRSVPANGSATIMIRTSTNKEPSWEFMKWWTSEDTQVAFAGELESILGASARYPTANKNALARLPWTGEQYNAIKDQMAQTVGIPEVPGGYYVPRHINNAFRVIVIEGRSGDPREVLLDYNEIINMEISIKRSEFDFDYIER